MKTYEELTGGEGRRVFYRAERFRTRDLFKRSAPDLAIDGTSHELVDMSLSGLGARAAQGSNDLRSPGARVHVQLGLHGIALFEGTGEVARVEPTPVGTKIGLRLVDRCLNIGQLVSKYQELLIRSDLASFVGQADSCVTPEYRTLCADMVHLMRTYRAGLERFEATKPEPAAAADMLAACEERILPSWRALWRQGNALVMPIMDDPAALRATKRFTELLITPDFLAGAIVRRSYEKPLGYPGDFQIMNMIYDWQRVGDRLFDKLMHRLGLEPGESIVTRMVMMRQAIAKTVSQNAGRMTRVASIGSGPAREVVDFLQLRELPGSVQFTLVDQDHGALSHAYERTYSEVMRLRGQASVACLHASFSQLLKAGDLFGALPPQDLIYTAGLVDYLAPRRAKALAASLYDRLAPGGALIIGNLAKTPESCLWPLEFICDWSLVYRDERDMRALAADLPGASVEVVHDWTGRVCVLTVRRAAA